MFCLPFDFLLELGPGSDRDLSVTLTKPLVAKGKSCVTLNFYCYAVFTLFLNMKAEECHE